MTIEQRLEQVEQQNQRIQRTNKRLTVALTMTVVAMTAVVTMAATGDKDGRFDTVWARTIYVTNDAGKIVVDLGADSNGTGMIHTQSANGTPMVRLSANSSGGVVNVFNKTGDAWMEMSSNISEFNRVTARFIAVMNDAGEIVVGLGANDAGDGLVRTHSAKGKTLVQLGATEDSRGMVTTHQPNGKELVALGSTVDGDGTVTTYQPNGKELVGLGASDTGGMVEVYNKTGEDIVTLLADEYGNGVVGAYNRKGKGRTLQPGP